MAALLCAGCTKKDDEDVEIGENDAYIMIMKDNKMYTFKTAEASSDNSMNSHGITWKDKEGGDEIGYITWEGLLTGDFSWNETGVQFWFDPPDMPNDGFYNSFIHDLNQEPGPGQVHITHYSSEVGGWVEGTFEITAGHREPDDKYKGQVALRGKFRARRVD
jgi:hypothetical protein